MNQSLKNIEIIVVNDCSPDNSEAIVLEYAAKDDRIVYIKHEENKCLGGARNTGIKAARGQYLTFVDSDDYVDVTLYEAALKYFEKYDIDVVVIPFQNFNESGLVNSFYRPCKKVYRVGMDDLLEYTYFAAWSKVYRTADLRDKNIVFPEHMYWEDVPFWAEYCALLHPRVWNLNDQYGFYWYRLRDESISGKRSQNYSQLPHVFLFLYQRFIYHNLIDSCFEDIYKIVIGQCIYAWQFLGQEYKSKFIDAFIDFVKKIQFDSAKREIAPVWEVLAYTDDFVIQEVIFQLHIDQYMLERELKTNRWYNFSQLSSARKIKFLFVLFLGRLAQVFTFKK